MTRARLLLGALILRLSNDVRQTLLRVSRKQSVLPGASNTVSTQSGARAYFQGVTYYLARQQLVAKLNCCHSKRETLTGSIVPILRENYRVKLTSYRALECQMSGFIEGENRQQATMFPERLEDYITEDNSVRVIDVFIDSLDLSGLGFKTRPSNTGRPGPHIWGSRIC